MSELNPKEVLRSDVLPLKLAAEETGIIIQRHEEYIRDPEDPQVGSLKPDANNRAYTQTEQVLNQMLEQLNPEERKTLDVMVVGSPTRYHGKGQRSLETAATVLDTVESVFDLYGLPESQILNKAARLPWSGGPIPSQKIVEPKIFDQSPEFVEFIKDLTQSGGINLKFFIAYEGDQEPVKSKRLEMGAEGPMDMANRMADYLYAMKLYSEKYHQEHPGRRLLIWTVSHYDTISPYLKTRIGGSIDGHIPVDYGAGIGIHLAKDGEASTSIGGTEYQLPLVRASTASSID